MNKQIFLFIIIFYSITYSQSLQTPTPLSPGQTYPEIESVDSDEIVLTWQSVKGADGYALNIIEFNGKVSRELINSSISGENIADTIYTLDNKIFKHNKVYSWNVIAKRGDQRSGFSKRFYFKIIKEIETKEIETKEIETKEIETKEIETKEIETKEIETKEIETKISEVPQDLTTVPVSSISYSQSLQTPTPLSPGHLSRR